ncbi:trna 2-phosphotransferase [Favolaschia claudopus]|uniref:2'-phosphotransferase n=1 Tax=Favolaschia claudopus TaxID=2862362 RepID=A0AAW0AYH6_9AGAR
MFRSYSMQPADPQPTARPRRLSARRRKLHESHQMRVSRQLSRLLATENRGFLPTRANGYTNVEALMRRMSFRDVDFATLEKVVRQDQKSRYHLAFEPWYCKSSSWWIRSNPRSRESEMNPDSSMDLRRIRSAAEIPVAFHGTSLSAWEIISKQPGLHRMSRNFIHLAKGVVGDMVTGSPSAPEVIISIDVARAIEADIKFYMSSTGVILTPGDEMGYLERRFFLRVERVKIHARSMMSQIRDGGKWEESSPVDKPPPERSLRKKEPGKVRRPAAAFLRHLFHRFFY